MFSRKKVLIIIAVIVLGALIAANIYDFYK